MVRQCASAPPWREGTGGTLIAMPSTMLRNGPPRRLFGPQGRLPVWAQWVIPLGIATLLIVALVLVVNHAESTANEPGPVTKASAIAEQNREARIVVSQDQAPHALRIAHPTPPARAIRLAVAAVMRAELRAGLISGPLQGTACHAAAGGTAGRLPFDCTAKAADVNYLFQGVVDTPARQVIVCKHDLAPVRGMDVPVSPRCR
jgi:hypothetical protein